MRQNSVFWKTSSPDNAVDILLALRDKYLLVQIAQRKCGRQRHITIKQFDSGNQFGNVEGIQKQIEFVRENSLKSNYQFYIIKSI